MVSTNGPQLDDQDGDRDGDDQFGEGVFGEESSSEGRFVFAKSEHEDGEGSTNELEDDEPDYIVEGSVIDEESSEEADQIESVEADSEEMVESETSAEATSTAVAKVRQKTRTPKKKRPSRIDRTVMEFQPDVVELEHSKVPGGARWTLYVAIALIAATIGWACWAEVDRIVIAQGELTSTQAPVLIYSQERLKILGLHAKFNDHVRAGDLLITLDSTFSQADVDNIKSQMIALQIRQARCMAELEERDANSDPQFEISDEQFRKLIGAPVRPVNDGTLTEEELDKRLEEFEIEDGKYVENLQVAKKLKEDEDLTFRERWREFRSELQRQEAERLKLESTQRSNERSIEARQSIISTQTKRRNMEKGLVEKGVSPETALEDIEMRLVSSKYELTAEQNKRDELVQEINVNAKQVSAYIAKWRSETSQQLQAIQQELKDLKQQLVKASHMQTQSEIRVPNDEEYGGKDAVFIVLEKADVSVGSTASPDQPIYRLMPVNAPLELEVQIDGRDVARLRGDSVPNPLKESERGDEVRIKLTSLPYQKHGTLEGRLRAISEGTFAEGQGMTQRMVYKGRVILLETVPENVPEGFRLLPGMSCTAEIKIGKRRVIDYFLYPLFRSLEGAIREP